MKLTDSAPTRPHMAKSRPPEGRGLAGEAAAATSDLTGEILGAPVRKKLDGLGKGGDDLCLIKGIGPKFEDALNGARLLPLRADRASQPDRDRAAGCTARRVQRPDLARPDRRAGRLSRPQRRRRVRATGSESFSRRLGLRLRPASSSAAKRSACRSCGRPCRRSRTTSRHAGISRRSPEGA